MPAECGHNGHMYYLVLSEAVDRGALLKSMAANSVNSVSHYVPLHTSPAGLLHGRSHGVLTNTDSISERLIRLPLWIGITVEQQRRVLDSVVEGLKIQKLL